MYEDTADARGGGRRRRVEVRRDYEPAPVGDRRNGIMMVKLKTYIARFHQFAYFYI